MSTPQTASAVRRSRPRAAFTVIELLVVILIVLLLASIFIPFLRKSREADNRVKCASNLRAIGMALSTYANANGGAYPRVVHDAANNPGRYFAFTGPFAPNPFAGDGRVAANDVTASLWLLVRGGYVSPDAFVCPSTSDRADPMTDADGKPTQAAQRSNFRTPRNLSYSYASPFSAASGYRFDANLVDKAFVVLADKNPGKSGGSDVTGPGLSDPPLALAKANSHNHKRAGQNVLYSVMSVEFRKDPYCAYGGDNIYTVRAAAPLPDQQHVPADVSNTGLLGPEYGPAWKWDTYLVPTAEDERPK